MKTSKELSKCHDCGVDPGQPHKSGCDVERCSVYGGQRLMCGCKGHDSLFARWTGLWHGWAECMEMGMYAKCTIEGWKLCSAFDPDGNPDLNTFYSEGYHKIFFIKPTNFK